MNVSHVALTMHPSGDLLMYRNKGRPTLEEVEKMECPKYLKSQLKKLKKEMNYKDGTDILLALSIASDEMSRCVHMFPEVFYMDVTAGTNRQKRDLFLMVVKDANGQTFIGNATVIPSGQRWVFDKIFQSFFLHLYGEETIGRNRLALTDDDKAEHGPWDNSVETLECYNESKHMLCVFHALVMAFHEKVYPKLPHKINLKKELTEEGEIYGKKICFILFITFRIM